MAGLRSQAPFTKGEVNRAGGMLLDLRERIGRDGADQAVAESDEGQLDRAWEALTWWRSLHARPLSSVAANLRYHVDEEGARVQGRIVVAQRLKRLPTVIDKLAREQGRVTQMHDIGGVRTVLPTLAHVHAVSRRLRKKVANGAWVSSSAREAKTSEPPFWPRPTCWPPLTAEKSRQQS